jgi:hypothetical protein
MNERLHDLATPDASECARPPIVALALCRTEPGQLHVGVLYEDAAESHRLLDLAWHHRLRTNPWADVKNCGYWWFATGLPIEVQVQIAEVCDVVAEKYRGRWPACRIPYAVLYRNGYFDPNNGELVLTGGVGLTCATFVLAIFASRGVRILDVDSWQARTEDRIWHEKILAGLRDDHAEPDHIAAVEKELGCVRFRPEEVVAGAWYPPAARFEVAVDVGSRIASLV